MIKMARGTDGGHVQEIVEEELSATKNIEGYSSPRKFHYHVLLNEYFLKMQHF